MSSPSPHQPPSPRAPARRIFRAVLAALKHPSWVWAILAALSFATALVALAVGVAQMFAAARSPFIHTHGLAAVDSITTVQSTSQPLPGCTPAPHVPGCFPDITPAEYAQVDYPLQMAVASSEQVTLILTTHDDQLLVGPRTGFGSTTVGAPVNLPSDVQNYQDVGVTVDTVSAGASPLVWQLIDAPRKSLLYSSGQHAATSYRDQVSFTWQVRALSAGQNVTSLVFTLYRRAQDGTTALGPRQMTSAPVPIIAVEHNAAAAGLPYVLVAGGGAGTAVLLVLGLLAQLKGANEVWEGLKFVGSVGRHAYEGVKYVREHQVVGHMRDRISRMTLTLTTAAQKALDRDAPSSQAAASSAHAHSAADPPGSAPTPTVKTVPDNAAPQKDSPSTDASELSR